MSVKAAVSIVLLGLLAVFIAQNYEIVRVRFLFWHLDMSRAVLLFLVLAMGMVIGWALSTIRRSGRTGRKTP
jgi:uncharacterized integral membrane protein